MTKTNEVRPAGVTPQTQTPTLNEKEAAAVQQRRAQQISAQDAARLASQAGFQRAGRKPGKRLDIGDSSHAPIPLPGDDLDPEAWAPDALDEAQENLTLVGAQFEEVAAGATPDLSIGAAVVGSSFLPTEGGIAELQSLADKATPAPVPLEEVTSNVARLFNIEMGPEVPVGHRVLATGLVVAGESESVHVDKGGINEQHLAGGLQKVTQRGNQAVGEAQKMSKGINKELNVQRTFVHKR